MIAEGKRISLVKPTLETPFHIDFDWWKQHDSNWRIFLFDFLCPEHQKAFKDQDQDVVIDFVDAESAEVSKVDGLPHTLMQHCAQQEGFIGENMSLVAAVFRIFLTNGNKSLTARELAEKSGKSATTILRTFSSSSVFKGIRPILK